MTQPTQQFPSLASQATQAGADARLRICIVTPDLLGPVKNGGIGTACAYLGHALADAGHKVSILYAGSSPAADDSSWLSPYREAGIAVHQLCDKNTLSDLCIFPDNTPLALAKLVYDWLASQPEFDLVLFMDWLGLGFYALHAKQAGLRFADTAMVIALHSPSLWHAVNNAAFPASPAETVTWHLERKAIAMADALISPSAYLLNWCLEHKYELPGRVFVQPNILALPERSAAPAPLDEVVFFGRLEYRKGLDQFCNAIDILARQAHLPPKIPFLGKPGWQGDEHSLLYIARRAGNWLRQPQLILFADHDEAMAYLAQPGRLAVMPSIVENSPYTVYECLLLGIPFLARDSGGTAELVARSDRQAALFDDRPAQLAEKIASLLGTVPQRPRLAFDPEANVRAWQEGLSALAADILGQGRPLISVCLAHYNRPHFLKMALASLFAQDSRDFELLLADDGSPGEETARYLASIEPEFARRGWRIFRLPNGYVGRARNHLASQARGEWLLFFDDDNVAMPDMLAKCALAAAKRKDGFISLMFNVFEGDGEPGPDNQKEAFLPVGDILAYSALNNAISDATCLIHRRTFERLHGFTEDYGIGHEDFELLLRAILAGESCAILPEPVFWYRRQAGEASMLRQTNRYANSMRSLRPFMDHYPAREAELALMASAMNQQEELRLRIKRNPQGAVFNDGRDAQSCETLAGVAALLREQGRDELAEQVLAAVKEQENPLSAVTRRHLGSALQAAATGDQARLRSIIAEFRACGVKESEQARFYLTILEKLPQGGLSLELLDSLGELEGPTLAVRLDIAGQNLAAGRRDVALAQLVKAWQAADEIYLAKRSDVTGAIRDGAFFCALQHFILHGREEMWVWPQTQRFQKLWDGLGPAQAELAGALAAAYGCQAEDIAALLQEFRASQAPEPAGCAAGGQ
ncbi:MAG: glycosyltransferase [Desulfovibrio sp.]|nr:glycosyltransferase [Desulfovibrio sp.]